MVLFVTRGSYRLQEVSIRFDWYDSVGDMGRLNVYLIVMENLYERNVYKPVDNAI